MADSGPILELAGTVPLQRQKSFHSSILFMQQEHSNTLSALHDEINKLQKRCSELTFQVAMGTTSSPQEDYYRGKSETLQKELDDAKAQLEESSASAEKKDHRISNLEQQLRAQETKYKDVIRALENRCRMQQAELSSKANQIAELQVNHLKISQENAAALIRASKIRQESDQETVTRNAADSNDAPATHAVHVVPGGPRMVMAPHPPREGGVPQRMRRRTSPRGPDGPEPRVLSGKNARKPHREPLGAALPRSANHEAPVPDPSPFLRREDANRDCPTPPNHKEPLPPINMRGHRGKMEGAATGYHDSVIPSSIRPTPKHRHKVQATATVDSSGASSPEVEVLAVDSVHKRNHKMKRAQEYNADYRQ